jgi:hypothetical protein
MLKIESINCPPAPTWGPVRRRGPAASGAEKDQ